MIIIILYFLSAYFLLSESYQIYMQRLDYFITIWNYLDILSPVLVIIVVSFDLKVLSDVTYQKPSIILDPVFGINFHLNCRVEIVTFHSIASLLMWLKFFYFLRIFRHTGNPSLHLLISLSRLLHQNVYYRRLRYQDLHYGACHCLPRLW